MNNVSIIGMSCVTSSADNYHELWDLLKNGRNTVGDFPSSRLLEMKDIDEQITAIEMEKGSYLSSVFNFDPKIFSISDEEAKYIDPQDRLLMKCTENALYDAGYNPNELKGENVGIFIGHSRNNYAELFDNTNPFEFVNSLESSSAARLAYTYDFRGEALCVDSACSSGSSALIHAFRALNNGEIDYAIVGASNLNLLPTKQGAQSNITSIEVSSSSASTKTFDNSADGFVAGEGCVVFFLRRSNDTDIQAHAVIKGGAINSNGRTSNGIASPSSELQAEVIKKAISVAKIKPSMLSYIETHGTGTKIGDPIEIYGISKALKELGVPMQTVGVGSVKSNLGHTGSVAGLLGVMKVVLMLKYQKLVPSINISEPNNLINFANSSVYLCTEYQDWLSSPNYAGVSSFGLTGINTQLILSNENKGENDEE